jgi:hypothetical protein
VAQGKDIVPHPRPIERKKDHSDCQETTANRAAKTERPKTSVIVAPHSYSLARNIAKFISTSCITYYKILPYLRNNSKAEQIPLARGNIEMWCSPNIGNALPKQLRARTLTKLKPENYLKTKSAAPTILLEDTHVREHAATTICQSAERVKNLQNAIH